MNEQTYGGYTLQQLRDKWRFCPVEYEVTISTERAEQGLDFCEVACAALPDLLVEVQSLGAALDAAEAEAKRLRQIIGVLVDDLGGEITIPLHHLYEAGAISLTQETTDESGPDLVIRLGDEE